MVRCKKRNVEWNGTWNGIWNMLKMDNYVTMPTFIRPRNIPCSCNLPVPVFSPTLHWAASTKHCLIIFNYGSGGYQLISSDNYATMLLPIYMNDYLVRIIDHNHNFIRTDYTHFISKRQTLLSYIIKVGEIVRVINTYYIVIRTRKQHSSITLPIS